MPIINLNLQPIFLRFTVTHDTRQGGRGQVLMHEGFGLIAFKLAGVVRVAFEIAGLQSVPSDAIQLREVVVKFSGLQVSVPVGEDELDLLCGESAQGRNQYDNFIH